MAETPCDAGDVPLEVLVHAGAGGSHRSLQISQLGSLPDSDPVLGEAAGLAVVVVGPAPDHLLRDAGCYRVGSSHWTVNFGHDVMHMFSSHANHK